MLETKLEAKEADILLLLEGTYPYMRGGVASWVYDIIAGLPQYRFAIIFLGAYPALYKEYAYPLPANLVSLQAVYLFAEDNQQLAAKEVNYKQENLDEIERLHKIFRESHSCSHGLSRAIPNLAELMQNKMGFDHEQFLHSQGSWTYITQQYSAYSTTPSFINYFWNIRNMHTPLWALLEAVNNCIPVKILHSISTGYAGFLGAMLQQRYQYPLILTEHGIYSKERNIELLQTNMFPSIDMFLRNQNTFIYEHELWIKFFDTLARTCYYYADPILSLFKNAQQYQIAAGAPIDKTKIIANGVDIKRFAALRRQPNAPIPKIICFIGRVVRIKDVKTFVRSVEVMLASDPDIVAWIKPVGHGDKEYIGECIDYINNFGLQDKIIFLREGDMESILPKIGLILLSSISEGMPLVLLESLAAGIPAIVTDVGACREIIEGRDDEDRKIGKCGIVVSISDAVTIAHEAINLLNNPTLWYAAQKVAIQRVEKYYNQELMLHSYAEIYAGAIEHGRHRI